MRAGSSSRTVGHKKKKPYKVVLESITQKKKKLRIAVRHYPFSLLITCYRNF